FLPAELQTDNYQQYPGEWINKAISLLNSSERPVIVAGNGIRLAKGIPEFLALVEHLQIPVLTTWLGMDLIHEQHELFVGRPGSIAPRGANFALQNSDLLLSIGARLDMAMVGYAYQNLARGAKKIIVDIDLSEIKKINTSIDLPIVSDAKVFIDHLMKNEARIDKKNRSAWITRCRDWKEKYPVVIKEFHQKDGPLSMYAFSEILADQLSEQDIIAPGSSGNALETFLLVFKTKPGQRIFHARGLGAMGFGLPASIGACIGSGGKRTICVDGDGGFQMNIQELETVARLNLPIKFFVINNNGFASIRAMQNNYFKQLTASDATSGLTLPDVVKLASVYNIHAIRISAYDNIREQINQVLAFDGPVVCEVVVLPDEVRAPRLSSKKLADGSMVSSPLEDLWPFLDREEFNSNMLIPPISE
ncbi:MAG: thiamine pyrophosphate-dependent enzyme, partial [Mariniphaga sp.]